MPRLRFAFAACTNWRPLLKLSNCWSAAALEPPAREAAPEGGTVAGKVWAPVQNSPQLDVAAMGENVAPWLYDARRSAAW